MFYSISVINNHEKTAENHRMTKSVSKTKMGVMHSLMSHFLWLA